MEIIILTELITEMDQAHARIAQWTGGALDLSYLLLYQLPPIPTAVTQLYCMGCHLTELIIPDHLTYINCSINFLTKLPPLPPRLDSLTCDRNQLTHLPPLPSTLRRMVCRENPLHCLPDLPHGFTELICSQTHIESLPTLPSTLQSLKCTKNRLMCLPPLPNSLRTLDCSMNRITELPSLPERLNELNCQYNPIQTLPDIPSSVSYFLCNDENEWARKEKETMYQHMDRVKWMSSQRRANVRCRIVKEEIMKKTWHSSRVYQLLLDGFDIEDM